MFFVMGINGARSGCDVRTRCIRGCTERRQGVSPGRISGMRRRLPASVSDASREALNSSKQREPPLLPLKAKYPLSASFSFHSGPAALGQFRPFSSAPRSDA